MNVVQIESDDDIKTKKCYGCKKEVSLNKYSTKKNGNLYSRCENCREKQKKSYHTNKKVKKGYCSICWKKGVVKRASFGLLSNNKQTHCSHHKTENMIDLINLKKGCIVCQKEGTFKRASFGLLSNKKKTHCSNHKTENMVDLKNLKNGCIVCQKEGTFKRASFGLLSNKKRTHCSNHKTDNMIDLINLNKGCIICQKEGTFKRACFGLLSNKKKTHCSTHKTENMVNLADINRGCIVCQKEGTFKRASFGKLYEKKIHCSVHKEDNEYYKNNPTCEECYERPYYGDEKLDEIPKRCEEHKKESDIDMISRKCDLCKDEYFIPSNRTRCNGCMGWAKTKKVRKAKEQKIANLLTGLSSTLGKPVIDRKVKTGCSNKRPDFFYKDFNDCFHLIVEVDENQHSQYTCGISGELQRLINIYEQDCGGFPLIVVRFNPDPYYYNNKPIKKYRGREVILEKVIRGLQNRKEVNYKIGIIYLYYDGFSDTNIEIEELDYRIENNILSVDHKHPLSKERVHDIILN